jgi:hemolysin III
MTMPSAPTERGAVLPLRRPLLRGWSHAVAAVGASVFTVLLVIRCLGDAPRLSTMLLYGLTSVWLFACSAIYHVVTWTPARRRIWRAMDHGNIYLMIAATSTTIGVNVLSGWDQALLLTSVWLLAGIGILVAVFHVRLSSLPRVGLYLLTGLTGLLALPGMLQTLPGVALWLIVGGGVLYGIGGAMYAFKRPDPFPRVFGYHEIFHLLVIAGWLVFAVVVWVWVVPFGRS